MPTIYKDNLLFLNNINENSLISYNTEQTKIILDNRYFASFRPHYNNNVDIIISIIKTSFLHYIIIQNLNENKDLEDTKGILELLNNSLIGLLKLKDNIYVANEDKIKIDLLYNNLYQSLNSKSIDIDENNLGEEKCKPRFIFSIYNNIITNLRYTWTVVSNYVRTLFNR